MLRGGAYTDEVVISLLNRRFTPFFYDVAPDEQSTGDGWAYDEAAVKAIGKFEGGRNGVMGADGRVVADDYPSGVIVTPDGKRLGEPLMGMVTPAELLAYLKGIMEKHPEHFKPTKEELEAEQSPLTGARLAWALGEFEAAVKRADAGLAAATGEAKSELLLIKAKALDRLGKWDDAMKAAEAAWASRPSKDFELSDDIQSEQGRILLAQEKWEDARDYFNAILGKYPKGDRFGEAMYYAGLANYNLGKKEKAKELWRRHAKELPKDRLARRSAISLGLPEVEAFLNQELVDRKGW